MSVKNKLELFKKLSIEHPNAYVQVGETFYPTRSELFDFELFRLAAKHNLYRKHLNQPIILTLEESQKSLFESFHDYLFFGAVCNMSFDLKGSPDHQLEGLLFLKSICNDEEIRKVLDVSASPIMVVSFIHLETWTKLMDYTLEPLFVSAYERREICADIHAGRFLGGGNRERNLARNEYALRLDRLREDEIEEKAPMLAKALKFYNVTFQDLKKEYKWVKYSSGSCGPN